MPGYATRRAFPNPYAWSEHDAGLALAVAAEEAWRQAEALLPKLDECAERAGVPKSTGRWSRNFAVYTGLGGIGLAYLRAANYFREVRRDEAAAQSFARKALGVANTCLSSDSSQQQCISFFCGSPGYLALACAACTFLGDKQTATQKLQGLLGLCSAALHHSEDELLFGRAGYLYALLWVRQFVGQTAADFDTPLRAVSERLVETGQARARSRYPSWPLMWHCFDEPYIGAAHGIVGNLAMLFRCYGLLSAPSQQLVVATLQKLLAMRFPSGNLPIVLGDQRDEHIHWCHGAPGLPGLLAAATEALGDKDGSLQSAASLAGEVVWERGVILKGNGLCHGIAGNAYTFLSLYRATGDKRHLSRAAAFAALLRLPELQEAMRHQPDGQRQVPGVPDSPCSLMEGSAGIFCFLLDMANPEKSAFPAWEI